MQHEVSQMQLEELMNVVSRLPPARQQEVIDFAAFLEHRYGDQARTPHSDWSEGDFKVMSVKQAMRGLEEEPELYSDDDVKERW